MYDMDSQNVEDDSTARQTGERTDSVTPKNTLLAMDSFFPVYDGVAVCIDNYANYLLKYGQVHLLTAKTGKYDDSIHPYQIVRLPATKLPNSQYRMIWKIFSIRKVRRLANHQFDIVHAHAPFLAGEIARTIARKQHIPLIGTFHTSYHVDIKRLGKLDFITRYFLRRIVRFYNSCDEVWAVNNSAANLLRSYGYKGYIRAVFNGTDLTYPQDAASLKARITGKYKLEPNEFVFCFCGRLMWYKGLQYCFEALAMLKEEGIKFRFFVIGHGEDQAPMEKMTKRLGIEEQVVFTGKISSREELISYYLRADLLLLLSTFDTDGLVTKEAAACRTPALLVKGSNAAEKIRDNENGFLVEEEPVKIFNRIRTIIADRELLNRVSDGAYTSLSTSWEEVVYGVAKLYDEIIEKKKRENVQLKNNNFFARLKLTIPFNG